MTNFAELKRTLKARAGTTPRVSNLVYYHVLTG